MKAALLASFLIAVSVVHAADPVRLPGLQVDTASQTVSGISSGGYMAVQMHVAFSSDIKGAGVIAAGPYHCANTGGSWRATQVCMMGFTGAINPLCYTFPFAFSDDCKAIDQLAIEVADRRSGKEIDPVANLVTHRVYLVAGEVDDKVDRSVVQALERFYRHYIQVEEQMSSTVVPNMAHTFPTVSFPGNACEKSDSPNISACNFDGAGEILKHLYPGLQRSTVPAGDVRNLALFDQTEFFRPGRAQDFGMSPYGWVYIPEGCREASSRCRLHVAFHGCHQTPENIQDRFPIRTGYNAWAEANGIVVLYPQAAISDRSKHAGDEYVNPNGCWDWWGYTEDGSDAWDTKTGRQMSIIKRMMERLAQPHERN